MAVLPLGILASSGGAAGAFELIQTATASGSSATITFTSIPSTYKHLQLRMVARSSQATTGGQIFININSAFTGSDTIYNTHNLFANGSSVISQSLATGSTWQFGRILSANDTASAHGATIVDLLDYTDTNKNRVMRYLSGANGTSARLEFGSGLWRSTTAVSSLYIQNDSLANWASGSRFSLYGIKG